MPLPSAKEALRARRIGILINEVRYALITDGRAEVETHRVAKLLPGHVVGPLVAEWLRDFSEKVGAGGDYEVRPSGYVFIRKR